MQSLFDLLEESKEQLNNATPLFNEQAEVVLGILRSSGAVPLRRTASNGHLHKMFAGCLVVAYNNSSPIYLSTRKLSTFYDKGYSTMFVSWLDNLVNEDLLLTDSPKNKAEGTLSLGSVITSHLALIGEPSNESNYQQRKSTIIPINGGSNNFVTATV